MKYRKEIDGLRALAVLPVLFFHAGFNAFSGGFVGVDIFFVISGYLITSIIIAELDGQNFSLVGFYERRARRILPALFVVMLACMPFAWLWMLPSEMKSFSKSLVAVSLYVSNILFWIECNYFETGSELKPLLHTWSLAVEEQFYVFYPLFVYLLWRFCKGRIIQALVVSAIISFCIAQAGSYYKPIANFFFLPPRGFELLIGGFVAYHHFDSSNRKLNFGKHKGLAQLMALLGVGCLAYAVFAFEKTTPFPSFYTLIPTIGTALIINYASPATFVGRVLSHPLLVGIGLVSYSTYLWHQPLFAFARLHSIGEPNTGTLTGLLVVSVFLAYLSWKFIERPFRNKHLISRKTVFASAGMMTLLMVTVGWIGLNSDRFDQRAFADGTTYQSIDFRLRGNHGLSEECNGLTTFSPECRNSESPEIAVWGDSFGMHLVEGILASNPNAKIMQTTWSFCGPFYDFAPFNTSEYNKYWAGKCLAFNKQAIESIYKTPSVKYVVLASPFKQYTSANWQMLTSKGAVEYSLKVTTQAFIETLQKIKDKGLTPVVFAPTPSTGEDLGRCVVVSKFLNTDPSDCQISLAEADAHQKDINLMLTEISKRFHVVWLTQEMCANNVCNAMKDGQIIYKDDGHLSYEGSAYLGKKMDFYKLITSGVR